METDILQVASRADFPALLNKLVLLGSWVELGIFEGQFSEHCRAHWKGDKYYLIDPWKAVPDYYENVNDDKVETEKRLKITRERMAKSPVESYKIIRATSEQSHHHFNDGSLDMVYLDGNHGYLSVKNDLKWWWPKIKSGGILAGHDYYNWRPELRSDGNGTIECTESNDDPERFKTHGVRAAVEPWAEQNKLKLRFTDLKNFPSFYCFRDR